MVGFFWSKRESATQGGGNGLPDAPLGEKRQSSRPRKRHLGILAADDDEVPGSVILLSSAHKRNEPLGLHNARARTSASSLPSPYGPSSRSVSAGSKSSRRSVSQPKEKKCTKDGRFILDPQPDDSANDPLNWKQARRDIALVSLGFYCMIGGGMTPLLAAGFNNVAHTYGVTISQVALTTGLYMLGLGIGSVLASPTAILWGKRPVYLTAIVLLCLTSVWCALSPTYASLVIARIVQGLAVSPVECLPSATIAEIFFLHERAYRLGIYTLLLLGGKNLIPLVSAAIVQSLGWRWIFKIVAIVVAFCFFLIFFFVPETFWDRTPHARGRSLRRKIRYHFRPPSHQSRNRGIRLPDQEPSQTEPAISPDPNSEVDGLRHPPKVLRVGFAVSSESDASEPKQTNTPESSLRPDLTEVVTGNLGSISGRLCIPERQYPEPDLEKQACPTLPHHVQATGSTQQQYDEDQASDTLSIHYTDYYRSAPPKSYVQSLKVWNGRLADDQWHKVAFRPFILFAYPAVLWSSLVYALAVGWLIVLSESVAHIYQNRQSYNFDALQVGLVYISPFIGGILGTAVAGKISDFIVRFMARKNDGVYEPEFRLVMAVPIAISTAIGLMGFGWSAEEKDKWIVPTFFFGVISFGCSLASTTAITFAVDSYRQYAGEALVTLNFSKNVFHGFVFSLFFPHWLLSSGPKDTFIAVGGIQLLCMLFSIPMYIYGKRARMWTVRKNLMERF